jgi:hypothetical protein
MSQLSRRDKLQLAIIIIAGPVLFTVATVVIFYLRSINSPLLPTPPLTFVP